MIKLDIDEIDGDNNNNYYNVNDDNFRKFLWELLEILFVNHRFWSKLCQNVMHGVLRIDHEA